MGAITELSKAKKDKRLLPVVGLVQSSVWAKQTARYLLWTVVLAAAALLFLPWQQTSRATGRVVAFVPQQRLQRVTAQAEGVIGRIGPDLREGTVIKKGDFIMLIEPLAAGLKVQMEQQLDWSRSKLTLSEAEVTALERQLKSYEEARDYAVLAADQMVLGAENKLKAKQADYVAYQAKERQAKLDLDRQATLTEEGLRAEREFEKIRAEHETAAALLTAAAREVDAALNDVDAKRNEREQKLREAQAKVDYGQAMLEKARGQVATYEKELLDLQIKFDSTLGRTEILAPQDGTLLTLPVFEQGQQIKKGDELFTIVPDTDQNAVELFVVGNDLPLIEVGAEVRLQFEGWPAVQFVGWPSIAIGSFGGQVAAIDATDDGQGQFRILVRPDPDQQDWPSGIYLRQGLRANGWVMLGQVPLWFELWRQLNGFPPATFKDPNEEKPSKVPRIKS